MQTRRNVRELVIQVLYQRSFFDHEINQKEAFLLNKKKLSKKYEFFFKQILSEFLKNKEELTKLIEQHAKKWKIKRIDKLLLCILYSALIELIYITDTDPQVIINEALEICRKWVGEKAVKFCNGILHQAATQKTVII